MPIRRIDLAEHSADRAAVIPAVQAAFAEAMPQLPVPKASRLRRDAPDGQRVALGAFESPDDAIPIGVSVVNETRATASTFWVAPASRRRGLGSALLAESLQLAKAAGHAKLVIRAASSTAAEGFAQARGGRLIERQRISGLDLAKVDRRAFEQFAAPSPANAGYTLVRWSDCCPDELAESFCAAMGAMADAPGDAYNTPLTIEALREKEQSLLRLGIHRHVHAAKAEDGGIAGFTNVVTLEDEPQVAEVWNTAVGRAHRGRGLGLRVKAAAALWLLDEHPQSGWMHTANHEANAPMLRINRVLGYRPLTELLNFAFDVA